MKVALKIISAGSLPYSALIVLLGLAFYIGKESAPATPKVAVAERGRVILEAVMDRQDMPKEKIIQEVLDPVKAVLLSYMKQGFVVLDSAKDENGNYSVAALPDNVIDITRELQSAVARKAVEPGK